MDIASKTGLESPPTLDQSVSEGIEAMLSEEGEWVTGTVEGLQLFSHFQPILSLAHQRVIGFEALLRATSPQGQSIAPLDVFSAARDLQETILLDRMSRAIHLRNFARQAASPSWPTWLFLNVNPQVLAEGRKHGSFLRSQLERTGVPPHRVVVEILEKAFADHGKLTEAVNYYRDLGCLIAIDDFGSGHSNFDRIGRLRPDIVKLDISIIRQAAQDPAMRPIVPRMVSLLHEAGSLVVMEGVESEFETMIAMDADADFVQGFFFERPKQQAVPAVEHGTVLQNLFGKFRHIAAMEAEDYRAKVAPYLNGLGDSSVLLKVGQPLEIACRKFLELTNAERCFLLDADGLQIGSSITAAHLTKVASNGNSRFEPLDDARGANWSKRHYFRYAVAHPETVHITRPYLSAANALPCITASVAFTVHGKLQVLCGDVNWSSEGNPTDSALNSYRYSS